MLVIRSRNEDKLNKTIGKALYNLSLFHPRQGRAPRRRGAAQLGGRAAATITRPRGADSGRLHQRAALPSGVKLPKADRSAPPAQVPSGQALPDIETHEFHLYGAAVAVVLDIAASEEAPGWRMRRRARILEAASRLFAEGAYPAVQMDDVAREAGMSKATVYRYFRSKEALYLEIFDQELLALVAALEALRRRGLAPRETMMAVISAVIGIFAVHLGTLRSLLADEAELAERIRRVFRGRRREINGLIGQALADGMAAGVFRQMDLEATPGILVGMCWGGVMGAPGTKPESLAQTIGGLFLDGACRAEINGRRAGSRPGVRVSRQRSRE
jgi:AcrR family transcriptional regulator